MTKDAKFHRDGTFDFLTSCHKINLYIYTKRFTKKKKIIIKKAP